MATHSSILTWRIPWAEGSGGYSPWGHKTLETRLKRQSMHTDTKTRMKGSFMVLLVPCDADSYQPHRSGPSPSMDP